jgi:hypothetical protein
MSAASGGFGCCIFWDCVTGGVIARRRTEQTPTLSLTFAGFVADVKGRDTSLYQFISAGGKAASVWGLDAITGEAAAERVTAPGMSRDYICTACSPGPRRQWLYLGTANGDVCVLHIGSRAVAASVFAGGGGICSLRVIGMTTDAILLLAGCGDGTVILYRHTPPQVDPASRGAGSLSAATPHAAAAIATRMGVGTGEGRTSAQVLVPVSSITLPQGAVWGLAPLALTDRSLSFLASTSGGALYTVNGSITLPDAAAAATTSLVPAASVYGRRGGNTGRPDTGVFGSAAPVIAPVPDSAALVPSEIAGRGLVARLVMQAHGAGLEGLGGAGALPSTLTLGATGAATEGLPPAVAASLRACSVVAVAFAPGISDRFVTAATDNTVRLWDAVTLRCANAVSVRDAGHPTCAAFITPDFTVSGWQDGCVRAYRTEKLLPTGGVGAPSASSDSFGGASRRRFGTSVGGIPESDPALLWALPNAHQAREGGVTVLTPAHNQRFFVSGGGDGAVRLWDSRR